MNDKRYNWQRFWCPQDGGYQLDFEGFLADPESESALFWNKNLKPLSASSINSNRCLILLGEPGIGKSKALEQERSRLSDEIRDHDAEIIWIDLKDGYGSTNEVNEELFENEQFKKWMNNDSILFVFIESMDECLQNYDHLGRYIIRKLKNLEKSHLERLYIRFVCRTAVWQALRLERTLRMLWSKDDVASFEMTPLRKKDVVEAAMQNGIDSDSFIETLNNLDLVPLAIKPDTLEMLFNLYERDDLHNNMSKADVYKQGCNLKCEILKDGTKDLLSKSDLEATGRRLIAEHMAAIMYFNNRAIIRLETNMGEKTEEYITLSELTCDGESKFSEGNLLETIKTGLFTSRGEQHMGWGHQCFLEFLAARWINSNLNIEQIKSIFFIQDNSELKLIPIKQEVIVWLASLNKELLNLLVKNEPCFLLKCDEGILTDENKSYITKEILDAFEKGLFPINDLWDLPHFGSLKHSKLATIIHPYIVDKTKRVASRLTALYIALHCREETLQKEISDICIDSEEDIKLRETAALFISIEGNKDTRGRLKPLLNQNNEETSIEIRRFVLQAVWPAHLTTQELFDSIDQFQADDVLNYSHILKHLPESDLTLALNWVKNSDTVHNLGYDTEKILKSVMRLGWERIFEPEIEIPFAEAALSRIRLSDNIIEEENRKIRSTSLSDDIERKHRLVYLIAPLIDNKDLREFRISAHSLKLNIEDDLDWLLENMMKYESDNKTKVYAHFAGILSWQMIHNNSTPDLILIDKILSYAQKHLDLKAELDDLCVLLDSEKAKRQKGYYDNEKELEKRDSKQKQKVPTPLEIAKYIEPKVNLFEKGKIHAWLKICDDIFSEFDDNLAYINPFLTKLDDSKVWKCLDEQVQKRIILAAKQYLVDGNPHNDEWISKAGVILEALAGYKALCIILSDEPRLLDTLPPEFWSKWAGVIIAFDGNIHHEHRFLAKYAYDNAPDDVRKAITDRLKCESEHSIRNMFNGQMQCIWDDTINEEILTLVKNKSINPPYVHEVVVEELLDRYRIPTLEYIRERIKAALEGNVDDRDKLKCEIRALVKKSADAEWTTIWPLMIKDVDLGKELIYYLGGSHFHDKLIIADKLTPEQLGDLFIFVEEHFPYAEDKLLPQSGTVSPRMSISSWKNNILNYLINNGKVAEVEKIHSKFNYEWLRTSIRHSKENRRNRLWKPIDKESLLKLAEQNDRGYVENEDQLLNTVIESLIRFEESLRNPEIPAWTDIWDEKEKNVWKPKREENYSNRTKRHLSEDILKKGLVVNREVYMNPTGQGFSETDICISAVKLNAKSEKDDELKVIIEAKLCDHAELWTAMDKQLAKKYLKTGGVSHGIYLVSWFSDKDSKNYTDGTKKTLEEARHIFEEQARDLSKDGLVIRSYVMDTSMPKCLMEP